MSGLNPITLFGLSGADSASRPAAAAGPATASQQQRQGKASDSEGAVPPIGSASDTCGTSGITADSARRYIAGAEAVILWRDPWRALFRVLGLGLYMALCGYQLLAGSLLVHPATLGMGSAFLYLAANVLRTIRTNAAVAAEGAAHGGSGDRPSTAMTSSSNTEGSSAEAQELRVFFAVQGTLQPALSPLIPSIASAAALVHRGLSGRHLVTSALAGACLWLGMLAGELNLIGILPLSVILYLAAFILPALYVRSRWVLCITHTSQMGWAVRALGLYRQPFTFFTLSVIVCREGLDVLVEDAARLALRLLLQSSRATLMSACAAALVVMIWARGWGLVLRASAAGITGPMAVLLWQRGPAQHPVQ